MGGHNGDDNGQRRTAGVALKRGRPLRARSKRIELKRCDAVYPDVKETNRFFEFALGTNAETCNIQTAGPKEDALTNMRG